MRKLNKVSRSTKQTNMSDAARSIIESAEISAAANADAKSKTIIRADKIDTESLVILNSMMEN